MISKAMKRWLAVLLTFALIFSFVPAALGAQSTTLVPESMISQSKTAKELAISKLSREKLLEATQALESHLMELENMSEVYIDPAINTASEAYSTVIVEYTTQPVVVQRYLARDQVGIFSESAALNKVEKAHSDFRIELVRKGITATVKESYEHVFSGVALSIRGVDVPKLAEIPGVYAVHYNTVFQALDPVPVDPEFAGAQPFMHESAPHIGADIYWDLGYEGEGIKVGVLDTGLDYLHPDLADAYKGGWDFVDNDPDPFEGNAQVTSDHGTHVAGTIAGRGDPATGGVRGVAPKADIYAYRVLGPSGGTQQWIVAAIEMAVTQGMDVINLSLGNSSNSSDSAHIRALNNAMLAGVVAVVANGNSGPNEGTVGQPATSPMVISVGATTPPANVLFGVGEASVTDEQYVMRWFAGDPDDDLAVFTTEREIVHVDLGFPEDFDGLDLTGKIALIRRGDIPFVDKLENAHNAGAVGAIIYNQDGLDGHIQNYLGIAAIPAFDMRGDDGRALAQAISEAEGNALTLADLERMVEKIDDSQVVEQKQSDRIDRGKPVDPRTERNLPEIPQGEKGGVSTHNLTLKEAGLSEDDGTDPDASEDNNDGTPEGNENEDEGLPEGNENEDDGQIEEEQVEDLFLDLPLMQTPVTFVVTDDYIERVAGDEVASFSSRGIVRDNYDIKPEVSAPGVAIRSTITGYLAGGDYDKAYGLKQGTSMAAPHVAGMAALLREARPDFDAFDVKVALMNTAKKIGAPGQYSLVDMGAGRIQGEFALDTPVLARVLDVHQVTTDPFGPVNPQPQEHYTGIVNFRAVTAGQSAALSKAIELENLSTSNAGYQVDFQWVDDAQAGQGVSFNLSNRLINVNAGGTAELVVDATVTPNAPAGRYEGFVNLTSAYGTEPNLHVPVVIYVGIEPPSGLYNINLDTQFYSHQVEPLNNIFFGLHNAMEEVFILLYDYEVDDFIGLIWYTDEGVPPGYWRLGWQGGYTDLSTGENRHVRDIECLCSVDFLVYEYVTDNTAADYDWIDMFVANQAPIVTIDQLIEDQVIDGTEAMLTGSADSIIAEWGLASLYTSVSYTLTHGGSTIRSGTVTLQDNGDFSLEGNMPNGAVLTFSTSDAAGNTHTQQFDVVGEREEASVRITGNDIYLGEQFDVTLGTHAVEHMIGAEFDLVYRSDIFELTHVAVNADFASYASNTQLAQRVLNVWENETGEEFTRIKLGATLLGASDGATGAVDILDLQFDTLPYLSGIGEYVFDVERAFYISVLDDNFDRTDMAGVELVVDLDAAPQSISGVINAQAFLDEHGLLIDRDYSQLTASIYAVNNAGEAFEGTLHQDGSFSVDGLHYDHSYTLKLELPGHFDATVGSISLVEEVEGGEFIAVSYTVDRDDIYQLAGEIIRDGTIDTFDLAIVAHWFGSDVTNDNIALADINQDGVINMLDLSLVLANFGETILDTPAVATHLTLEQILDRLSRVSDDKVFETIELLKRGGAQ